MSRRGRSNTMARRYKGRPDTFRTDLVNHEDIKKRKVCGYFKETKQLTKKNSFKNIDNERRYYDDIKEEKIVKNNSEEIEEFLNEEYLLEQNDHYKKCYDELNYKDVKKEKIYKNNSIATERLDEEIK